MTAYRNLFNEFLSKDTSKKIRTVKRSCMERGKYLGTYAPLGYKKDSTDRHKLVIDYETAHIVRRIFEMRCGGHSYRSIALALNEDQIPSPRAIYYRRTGRKNSTKMNGVWGDSTVSLILRNEVYIGHMVQGKYSTISYKNRKIINKQEEQWVRVENTHKPLIEMDQWLTVQLMSKKNYKPRKDSTGMQSMFTGILKCADCGFNMRANIEQGKHADGSSYRYVGFICGNYSRSGKTACTVHTIYERTLTELVLHEIRKHTQLAVFDEQRVINNIMKTKNSENLAYLVTYQQELKAAEERLAELDSVIQMLYEDRVGGIITESMFKNLISKYEQEREYKIATMAILQSKVAKSEHDCCDIESWLKNIRKYIEIETLTQDILLDLIDRIEIFEAERVGRQRICRIRIVYRFHSLFTCSSLPK